MRQGLSGRWALFAWGVIALCVGAFLWARYKKFEAKVRRNRVRALEGEELDVLEQICQRYGIRKKIPVYFVDRIASGCIAGVWEPFIALPLNLPKEYLPLALSHQLCHWKARDNFWGMMRGICCAVHWFNPLVWMGAWLCYRDSEMASDDRVTARLHDIDRLAYANVIVSASQKEVAMSMGATVTNRHLRQRVTAVIRCVRGSRIGIALTSLAAALVLIISFATGESEPLPTVQAVPAVAWSAAAVPIAEDMDAIGRWMKVFGDAVYNGRPYLVKAEEKDFVLKDVINEGIYYFFKHDLGIGGSENVVIRSDGDGSTVIDGFTLPVSGVEWMDNGEALDFVSDGSSLRVKCTSYPYGTSLTVRVAKITTKTF
jgi:hypothetical protein